MKKTFFLPLFMLLPLMVSGQVNSAETENSLKQADARQAALRTCKMVNKVLDDIHPEIIKMVDEMLELGQTQAIQNFTRRMESMSSEDQAEIMADMQVLMNFDSSVDQEEMERIESDYEKYKDDTEFQDLLVESMNNIPECELPAKIVKISESGS